MSNGQKVEQAPALNADDQSQLEQLAKDAEKKNLDTSVDMNQIKTNIDDIKKSVEGLKTEMDDFEKNKNTLTKEVVEQKQKDIEAKKVEIEQKKKETQELIAKIRKERVDLKLETLDDATKKLLIEQKNKDEALLAQCEKDLQAIQPQNKSFREKIKEKAGRAREWVKEHPVATGGIAVGATLLIGWIGGRFKHKEEDEEDENGNKIKKNKKKKGFWNHGIGKVLKVVGIGAAIGLGLKWLWDRLKPETVRPPEEQKSDFDKLSGAEKLKYSAFADRVNDHNKVIYNEEELRGGHSRVKLGLFYGGKEDANYRGLAPFAIDQTYGRVGAIISERGIDKQIMNQSIQEWENFLFDSIIKDNLSKVLGPFLMNVEKFTVLGYKPGEDMARYVKERLRTDDKATEKLEFFFGQFISIGGYLMEMKAQISDKIAIQELRKVPHKGKNWDELTQEEKDEILYEFKNDKDWMDKNVNPVIKSEFEDKRLIDLDDVLQKYSIDDKKVSPDLQRHLDEVNETNNDLIDYDKDTNTNVFDRALKDIADGELENNTRKDLAKCAEKISKDAINEEGTGFMQTYFEPFSIMCNSEGAAKEEYYDVQENTGGRKLLEQYAKTLADFKIKFETGIVTADDIEKFKDIVNQYFIFKKEVVVAVHAMTEMNANDPEYVARFFTMYWHVLRSFGEAFYKKMGLGERAAKLTWGFIFAGGAFYIAGSILAIAGKGRSLRVIGKSMFKIGVFLPDQGMRLAFRMTKLNLLEHAVLPSWYWRKIMFDSSDPEQILRYAVMNGRINKNGAVVLAQEINLKTLSLGRIRGFKDLISAFGDPKMTPVQVDLVEKYFDNSNVRKLIVNEDKMTTGGKLRNRWKYNITERRLKYEYTFDLDNITKVAKIETLPGDASGKILKSALNTVSKEDFALLYNIANKDETLKALTNWIKGGTMSSEDLGRVLGKNLKYFKDLNDFEFFLKNVPLSSFKNISEFKIVMQNRETVSTRLASGEKFEDILKDFSKFRTTAKEAAEEEIQNIATYLKDNRWNNKGIPEGFEPGGKFEKYAPEFEGRYKAAKDLADKGEQIGKDNLDALDRELAERLSKDGRKLDDILGLTVEQKDVYKFVQKDIQEIKIKIKSSSAYSESTRQVDAMKIKNMKAFERQLGDFSTEEISAFENLKSFDFKTYHIIELLKLKRNPAIAAVLGESPDFAKIINVLKQEKSAENISDELIKSLGDLHVKPFMKSAEAAAAFFKNILKFAGRVLKIIE